MADDFSDGLDDLPGDAVDATVTTAKPDPKAAPPKKAEPKPEPTKHQHTQRLVAIARQLGFTQDDLDNHPSAVIWEEIHNIQAARRQPEPAPKKPEPEADDDETLLKELEESLEPKAFKLLKRMHEQGKSNAALKAKLDQIEEREKKQAARTQNDMGDAAFAALPKPYKVLVGEGSFADLDDPGAFGWRNAIWRAAGVNFDTDSQGAITRKVRAAAEKLAKGKIAAAEPEEEEEETPAPKKVPPKDPETGRFTTEQFAAAKLAKGSARKTGIDQLDAVEVVRQYQRTNGYVGAGRGHIDGDNMDDLPG